MTGERLHGEVIPINSHVDTSPVIPDVRILSTEFASHTAPYILDTLYELGLDNQFVPIVGRHIAELRIAETHDRSTLDVHAYKEEGDKRVMWRRVALLSHDELITKREVVESVFSQLNRSEDLQHVVEEPSTVIDLSGENIETQKIRDLSLAVATEWVFYELAADAVASSYYMQQKWNRYIADFNGQSPHYAAELSIAQRFLEMYADQTTLSDSMVRGEYNAFRSGLGLILLQDSLLRNGVTPSRKINEWVIQGLTSTYPSIDGRNTVVEPYSRAAISERLTALIPKKNVEMEYFKLSESVRAVFEDGS